MARPASQAPLSTSQYAQQALSTQTNRPQFFHLDVQQILYQRNLSAHDCGYQHRPYSLRRLLIAFLLRATVDRGSLLRRSIISEPSSETVNVTWSQL
ncbi:hypothetical protein NHJ13051_005940 [Beauveria bassiana]